MSVAWLEVPAPTGDLAAMQDAADLLTVLGRRIDDGAEHVVRVGSTVVHAWEGEAGSTFQRQQATARRAIASLAQAHVQAADQVRVYAADWETAQRASERARADIEAALGRYHGAAKAALEDVAGFLERVLDNPVMDVLGHVVPLIRELQARVHTWQAPGGVPYLTVVPVSALEPIAQEHVLDQLHSAGEWAASRVLDGIEAVVGLVDAFVDGGIHAAISLVHAVERAFAAAVTAAQAMARAALAALVETASLAAAAIRAVVSGLVLLWEVGYELVELQVAALLEIGHTLLAAMYLSYEVGLALFGLSLILHPMRDPTRFLNPGARRVDPSVDDEAMERWISEAAWRQHVVELADLASSSYQNTGAPDGWTRLESISGPEGFAAAVYQDRHGHVVVAFRGSEGSPIDIRDWSQDSLNAADLVTAQGAWAIKTAKELAVRHPGLEFTGHSLGGSLAATASIATDTPTVTFNAAGVGRGNHAAALMAGAGAGGSEEQITNFATTRDFLTLAQEHGPVFAAAGAQITIASNTDDPFGAHGLDAFKDFGKIREAAR